MIWSLIGAAVVGVTLGLLGSGGSILTVPVLVYLLGHAPKSAIAESLGIVAGISAVGLVPFAIAKRVQWLTVLMFGVPGMIGTAIGATMGAWISPVLQLVAFGAVMLLAAALMFRTRGPRAAAAVDQPATAVVARRNRMLRRLRMNLDGFVVGVITGIVGVGGGFLIVPALVIFGGLKMREAVGTSLVIICLKSTVGFAQYLRMLEQETAPIDFGTIALFAVVGAAGAIVGGRLNQYLPARLLQRLFAVFLLGMGIFVIVRELAVWMVAA